MKTSWSLYGVGFRRKWMLAGFAAAFLVGDMLLYVREAQPSSVEFLFGVAGYALAHLFWMAGQLREVRPDGRVFLAVALPLVFFVMVRLHPSVLPPAAAAAACAYSLVTAVSFATALATRRVFYVLGIGLLFFSDMMIGGGLQGASCCNWLIRPTYLASEACIFASFLWGGGEWRIPFDRSKACCFSSVGGTLAFTCFAVSAFCYPGGGYNPFMQMLSVLGRTEVNGVAYPACHFWFMAGMFLSAASVLRVWVHLASRAGDGWRRYVYGWGGALNAAGLCIIALVPENVNMSFHNSGCHLATFGGGCILVARLGKGADLAWAAWLVAVVIAFMLSIFLDAIPFSPWATTLQKTLIVSFALWSGWLSWISTPRHGGVTGGK